MIAQEQLIGVRFEKCLVERLIGRGGYGLTFLAFDEELKENRVIKVSQDAALDENTRQRHLKSFLEEGLILSRLKHPQIVTLRGQGEMHGHRYMILDYIQGFSIRNIIDIISIRQSQLGCEWSDLMDPVTATALVLSALYPLEYAHRANVHLPDREIFGVAHRDISPGNLILGVKGNEKGRLILIDFGTAKTDLAENITVDQNLVGTIPYMDKARLQKANSPEQAALYKDFWKDFRETQHDIHALGVLYFQLLTGKLPFAGESAPQIIVKILDPEAYTQCHLEIASAHPYASTVLNQCIIYHDLSKPLHEHPFQYPNASAMLPDMVSVFDALAYGKAPHEVLIAFGKKLAHPENWNPNQEENASITSSGIKTGSETWETSKLPYPTRYLPIPGKAKAVSASPSKLQNIIADKKILIGVLSVILILLIGFLWYGNFSNAKPRIENAQVAISQSPPAGNGDSTTSHKKASLRNTPSNPPLKAESRPTPKTSIQQPILADSSLALENLSEIKTKTEKKSEPKTEFGTKIKSRSSVIDSKSSSEDVGKDNQTLSNQSSLNQSKQGQSNFTKSKFIEMQLLVRKDEASAFDQISDLLLTNPNSADLRFLKCQLILQRNPGSMDARKELAIISTAKPEFIHPELFKENILFQIFEFDAAQYESQKTQQNRQSMQKSGNTYLLAYQKNTTYAEKAKMVLEKLGH